MARKNIAYDPRRKRMKVLCVIMWGMVLIGLAFCIMMNFDEAKALYETVVEEIPSLYQNIVDMVSGNDETQEYKGMSEKEPYKINYVSNGDGTCYVSEIITNPLYDGYYNLEIPSTSSDGDTVIAINSSGFLGSLIQPMMLQEDFERYIQPQMLAFYAGDENNFYYKQFMSYWQLKGLEFCQTSEAQSHLIYVYPIVRYTNIYVFDPTATVTETFMREEDIRFANPEYTPDQCYLNMMKIKTLAEEKGGVCPENVSRALSAHTGGGAKIQKIILPDTLQSIGAYAFAGCSNVGYVDVPDSVTSIGEYAFAFCESLVDIDIPQGVTEIKEGTYMGCHNLVNLVIPNHIVSIEAEAFSDCAGLISVRIPESVQSIDTTAFGNLIEVYNASEVSHDVFGDINVYSPTEGESKLITLGDFIFYYNEKDSSLCLEAYIGTETDIVLPSSVEINGELFEEYAVDSGVFYCDRNITSILIPDAVINRVSLHKCESLKSITIFQTKTDCLGEAFGSCRSLKEITFGGTQKQWEAVFGDEEQYPPRLNEYTVHCSDGDIVIEEPERVTFPIDVMKEKER